MAYPASPASWTSASARRFERALDHRARVWRLAGIALSIVALSIVALPTAALGAYLPRHKVVARSLSYSKYVCNHVYPQYCRHYGVGRCVRVSRIRVNCRIYQEYEHGVKSTCKSWMYWRRLENGRLSQRTPFGRCVVGWRYPAG
jgi:hypothetical protein